MDMERSLMLRTEEPMRRTPIWNDLPPAQAGLASALRRAYAMQPDETLRQFEELLNKLN